MTIVKRVLWTAERDEVMRALYKAGRPCAEIASTLNARFNSSYSATAISNRANSLKLPSRHIYTDWTAAMEARLTERYRAPNSPSFTRIASEINAEFGTGFSRGAIIGKAHRLGLNGKKPASTSMRYGTRKPRQKAHKASPSITKPKPPRPSAEIIRLRCAEVRMRNLTFEELQANDCRYPEGSAAAEYRFCGNPQHAGSSYCLAHHLLCEQPAKPRVRSAA